MPRNFYPNKTVEDLLPIREAIMDARNGGNQTHVGIAQGIFHEFSQMKPVDLDRRLMEVDWALHLLDPDTYENPYGDRTGTTRSVFC